MTVSEQARVVSLDVQLKWTASECAIRSRGLRRLMAQPRISIVIVAHQMTRELPRTLQSLLSVYQVDMVHDDYEVVVVDNGSAKPIDSDMVGSFGPNFRCLRIDNAPRSPVHAMNLGVGVSRGEILGIMLDGARLLTPGVLKYASLAFSMYRDPTVATLSWHLGPTAQQRSIRKGYDRKAEDRLLADIQWPSEGYRLFEIACPAPSSERGLFLPMNESNAIFLRRSAYQELGGYDERFDLPGGGFANLDFFKRASERPASSLIVLLGEGAFHQFHGGVSTNVHPSECARLSFEWAEQYERIRGERWKRPRYTPVYLGTVTPRFLETIAHSAGKAMKYGRRRHSIFGAVLRALRSIVRRIKIAFH